jgi:arylsulfatase A-like enzyme
MKENVYTTGIGGKWQLDYGTEIPLNTPAHFGFDEYCLWNINGNKMNRYKSPVLYKNGGKIDDSNLYGPDVVNDFILNFIEDNKSKPFFAYYPMILPHDPFQHTPITPGYDTLQHFTLDDPVFFKNHVAYIDLLVGKVLDKLDELNIRDNTIIILTGDNGTKKTVISKFKGSDCRGGRDSTSKAGTHVPLIVDWSKSDIKKHTNDNLIDFSDFYATLIDIIGAEKEKEIDGNSFYNQILGKPYTAREFIFTCSYRKKQYPRKQLAYNKEW